MSLSLAGDVYGGNMTRTQARRLISRSRVTAPKAMAPTRTTRILSATAAVECDRCGNSTMNGIVYEGAYLCLPCAHRASE